MGYNMFRREINGEVDESTRQMDIEQFASWSVGKLKADKRQCVWWFCYYHLGNGMVDTNGTARSQLTCTKNDNNWYGWTQSIWGSDLCNNFLVPLVHFISWFIKCLTLTTYKISYRWFVWFVTNLAFDLCNLPKSFADSWHSKRVGNFSAVDSLLRNRSQLLSHQQSFGFTDHVYTPQKLSHWKARDR